MAAAGEKILDTNLESETDYKLSETTKIDILTWKPRCIDYYSKWRACAASSNQFHKYYQYGEFEQCQVFQQDLKQCFLWKSTKSLDALEHLTSRKQEELRQDSEKFAHKIWEKREDPQKDWHER